MAYSEEQVFFVNSQGERLAGTLALPSTANKYGVVLGHCFTCSRHTRILVELSQSLAEAGFLALRFDFSGNGRSEGDFADSSYTKHIEEMETAVSLLKDKGVSWFGLSGHSMGAAIALMTSARVNASAVVTLAGRYSSLDPLQMLDDLQKDELSRTGRISFVSRGRSLELKDRFFQDAYNYNLSDIIRSLKAPVLAVHGDRDEIIPVSEAAAGQKLNPARVKQAVIKGADHMFVDESVRQKITGLATEWFKEQAGFAAD